MKVSTILDKIDEGALALPEFQRGYVWNRAQVRGLMQSLYRRYPVGGLLTWLTILLVVLTFVIIPVHASGLFVMQGYGFAVVLVMDDQRLGRQRFGGMRDFEFRPWHADLLFQPPLDRRTNAFGQAQRSRKEPRIANERGGRCDLHHTNFFEMLEVMTQSDADPRAT